MSPGKDDEDLVIEEDLEINEEVSSESLRSVLEMPRFGEEL